MLRLSSPPRRGLLPVNTSSAPVAGRPAGHAASPRRLSTATWARRRPGTTVDARCPTEQGGAPQTCGVSTTACCGPARGRRRQTGTPRSCALSVPSSSTSPAVGARLPNGTRASDLLHPRFGRADRLPDGSAVLVLHGGNEPTWGVDLHAVGLGPGSNSLRVDPGSYCPCSSRARAAATTCRCCGTVRSSSANAASSAAPCWHLVCRRLPRTDQPARAARWGPARERHAAGQWP